MLQSTAADGFSAQFELPRDLALGEYTVLAHGRGGVAAWASAGKLQIVAPPAQPTTVFSVLETYGPDAAKQMRGSLNKYVEPIDRTEGILAALKKAKANGGGVVYFPAGRYAVKAKSSSPTTQFSKGKAWGWSRSGGEPVTSISTAAGHKAERRPPNKSPRTCSSSAATTAWRT